MTTDAEVQTLVAEIGRRLQGQQDEIGEALSQTMFEDIEGLDGDPQMMQMLRASVDGNINTIFHVLSNDIPLDHLQPTTAAMEYAVRAAQRGIPSNALRRAYHVGQNDLIDLCFQEVQDIDCSPELRVSVLHRITLVAGGYIDWITQVVGQAYDEEWERHIAASGNMRSALVNRVLNEEPVAMEEFLAGAGYDLDQHHVGAVLWLPAGAEDTVMGLERFVQKVAGINHAPTAPIFVAVDGDLAWAWFPRGSRTTPLDTEALCELASGMTGHLAIGLPHHGLEGFRRTHRQALAAHRIAQVAGAGQVTSFGDPGVAAVSMLGRDLEGTRDWVRVVLGPLAEATEGAQRARETLRIFLATGGSYTESAKRLNLHRNSVKYRVDRVFEDRGGPLGEARLDVELALAACAFLGDSVLS